MPGNYPHELSLGDVYFSPLLPVVFFAFVAAVVTISLLNRFKLARFFYAHSYVFLALLILYMLLIDALWISF